MAKENSVDTKKDKNRQQIRGRERESTNTDRVREIGNIVDNKIEQMQVQFQFAAEK